jgi:hypothetical protein
MKKPREGMKGKRGGREGKGEKLEKEVEGTERGG